MRKPLRRTRALSGIAVCLLLATGCGGGVDAGAAPTTAAPEDFCLTYVTVATRLAEKVRVSLAAGTGDLPDGEELAASFHDWAAEMVEVGTPSDIGPEARAGFENWLDEAATVDADELDLDLDELLATDPVSALDELSSEEFGAAVAMDTYVQDTCSDLYRERGLM